MWGSKLGGYCMVQVNSTVSWTRVMIVEMAENWTLPRGSTSKEKITGLGETLEMERDCRQ